MYRGNVDKVMTDAAKIVRRLQNTDVTLELLTKEYHCGHYTIKKAILSRISKSQWLRIRRKKLAQCGVKTRFQKGHITHNKGLKGIRYSPQTEFKKGHLPVNHKHIGTIRMRNDKSGNQYRDIKVSGILQGRHKWITYARYIWEKANGPIPKGFFVVHTDGNTLNDEISNLQLVNRAGHLALIKERDPEIYEKIARAHSRTMRKKRKVKERQQRIYIKKIAKQQKEGKLKQQVEANKEQKISWWECKSCGCNYGSSPPDICHKCNGIRFEKIEQKIKMAI